MGKRRQFRSSRFAAQATDRISNDIPDGPLTDLTRKVVFGKFLLPKRCGGYTVDIQLVQHQVSVSTLPHYC